MNFKTILGVVACVGALALPAVPAGAAGYKVVNGGIPDSLTGKSGDPYNGRKVMVDRRKGNCLACHVVSSITDQQFHGNIGPALDGVGATYTPAELRLRVADPKVLNPDTIMPAFFKTDGLHRVQKKWQGKTIVSAQEVEDIIAYLETLKKK